MRVIDKWLFESRGAKGCSNSAYRLQRTSCCGNTFVEDDELLLAYFDASDLSKTIDLGYSPKTQPPPRCPFCGSAGWSFDEITNDDDVPRQWRFALVTEPEDSG